MFVKKGNARSESEHLVASIDLHGFLAPHAPRPLRSIHEYMQHAEFDCMLANRHYSICPMSQPEGHMCSADCNRPRKYGHICR